MKIINLMAGNKIFLNSAISVDWALNIRQTVLLGLFTYFLYVVVLYVKF